MNFKTLPMVALLMLSGCSLIPDYQRPASPVETSWPEGQAYGPAQSAQRPAPNLPAVEQFFKAPALVRLLNNALENNRDLRIAAKNVDAYRALYRIQRAERFPTLDGSASGDRRRAPDDLSSTGQAGIESRYQVGLVTAYELDLFGRIRSLSTQALERYLATEEAQRSVHIALIGDVATTYFLWRTDQLYPCTLTTSYPHTAQAIRIAKVCGSACPQARPLFRVRRQAKAGGSTL